MNPYSNSLVVLIAIAFGFAATPAPAQNTPEQNKLYEAAKAEGELTWYVSQYSTSVAEKVGAVFTERYPGVKVNVVRTTGQVAYARLMQDIRAGVPQCDVLSGTDLGHMVALKEEGHLLKYTPEGFEGVSRAYKGVDPDGYYYGTAANPTILIYNTNLVEEKEAPTNWTDLIDEKWRGQVAVAHPGYSGSMGSWVVMIQKLYGWEFFERLEEMDPLIGRSLNDPISVLNAGERAIGISGIAIAARNMAQGNPIAVVYPTDGAKLTLSPSAILANTTHPNAAKLFMDHLHSIEHSKLLVAEGYQPIRPEVDPPAGVKPLDDMKLGPITEEEVTEQVPEVIVKWRDTFGN